VSEFLRSDRGLLRAEALLKWREAAQEAVRCRAQTQAADAALVHTLQQKVWKGWARGAARSRRRRKVADVVRQAVTQLIYNSVLKGWQTWCQKRRKLRSAELHVYTKLWQSFLQQTLRSWGEAAKHLAALETRYLLQVDDFRRRARRRARTALFLAWFAEATRMVREARLAKIGKVFACWHLAAQEQLLLRRYLRECSVANFKGVAGKSSPSTVGPADLERVYREMAEHRWDALELSE